MIFGSPVSVFLSLSSLSQAHTEAGLPYRCACCMSWCTPPAAWATRACLYATCPSCCRPCWTSCLIKVSKRQSTVWYFRISSPLGFFQLYAQPSKETILPDCGDWHMVAYLMLCNGYQSLCLLGLHCSIVLCVYRYGFLFLTEAPLATQ